MSQTNYKVKVPMEDNKIGELINHFYQQAIRFKSHGGMERFDMYSWMTVAFLIVFAAMYSFVYVLCDSVIFRKGDTVF